MSPFDVTDVTLEEVVCGSVPCGGCYRSSGDTPLRSPLFSHARDDNIDQCLGRARPHQLSNSLISRHTACSKLAVRGVMRQDKTTRAAGDRKLSRSYPACLLTAPC
ncbi:hypothetical protein RRG08_003508 [Elysia crispata]|uniref:Uncharacterized protein n=1 Tax=Elysia crispata TaxID=231223 RepID=A0AAE0Y834_9GAST|nr:hypothetical protein RRG08_003508 [Elysia crispata]